MKFFMFFVLFNGVVIFNCLVKVVMEENMVDVDYVFFDVLLCLYEVWVVGGVGLILIGNVMVDYCVMIGLNGVVLEDGMYLECFCCWVQVVWVYGVYVWVQINYLGCQMLVLFG